ncbi:MAG: hypothetical protein K9K67_02405 [Bacteriovoracaceae bacterium]|nr:hypothetical protein [Bacteriovoracaceae bacterium]
MAYVYLVIALNGLVRKDKITLFHGLLGALLYSLSINLNSEIQYFFLLTLFLGNLLNYITANRRSEDLSYLMLVVSALIAPSFASQPPGILFVLVAAILANILFLKEERSKKAMWLSILSAIFLGEGNAFLVMLITFFVINTSITIYGEIFKNLIRLEFEDKKLLIGYGELAFLLLAALLLTGVYGTPPAWIISFFLKTKLAHVSLAIGWLALLVKELVVINDRSVIKDERFYHLFVWFLIGVLLKYSTELDYESINPYFALNLIVLSLVLYLYRKKPDYFLVLKKCSINLEFELPRIAWNLVNESPLREVSKISFIPNQKLFFLPSFSYSFSVMIIFLFWLIYIIGVMN